uniref:Putative N-acetylglucosaminylphosphatidylinositol de-N-acetylase n=1 Tax=viral metagenome TaxID=1070528 RepID=A0A6M3IXF3_9ZZZZ
MKTLIIASHPDDEILGCGGTTLKLMKKQQIYSLVLNQGGRDKSIFTNKVSDFMGFTKSYQLDFPDNRFDTVPLADIIKAVEGVKNEVKPDAIFTHFEHDLNKDHQLTFQAVLTATRPMRGETVKELYSFEIPSSTEWKFPNVFAPNVFIDISDTIEKKIKAFGMYGSEVRPYPHPRSPEAMRIIAKRWGILSGLKCAEAFYLVRKT